MIFAYILDDADNPVATGDVLAWAKWMEDAWRSGRTRVAQDTVGDIRVSTVFLGLDHGAPWDPEAVPILYETMVFGGQLDRIQMRYPTRAFAVAGHAIMVERVRAMEMAVTDEKGEES